MDLVFYFMFRDVGTGQTKNRKYTNTTILYQDVA